RPSCTLATGSQTKRKGMRRYSVALYSAVVACLPTTSRRATICSVEEGGSNDSSISAERGGRLLSASRSSLSGSTTSSLLVLSARYRSRACSTAGGSVSSLDPV